MTLFIITLITISFIILVVMLNKGGKKPIKMNIFEELEEKSKGVKKGTLLRLIGYVRGKWKYFIIAFIGMIIVVVFNLLQPIVIATAYELLAEPEFNKTKFTLIMVFLVVIMIVSSLISYFQAMSLQKAGQRIIYEMREQVFTKIESLSIDQLNATPVGKLVTRVTSDTGAINEMYTRIIINLISNVLTLVGVIIAMFIVNASLAWCVIAIAPIIAVLSFIFRRYSIRAHREVREGISNVNANLSENISGMKITQAFNQEDKQIQTFINANDKLYKSSFKQIFIFGIFRPAIYALYVLTIIIVLYVGSMKILDSNYVLNFSMIIIFYQYIERFYNPIQQLADQFNSLQSALAAGERIFAVLDTEPTIKNKEDAIKLEKLNGEIEFKNVWFSYVPDEWVLKDVSFKINARETCAFVGATGSGKTTILSLIVRNYDIQKGQILIDGIDIKDIDISSLRKCIGQMLQDVFLFSGTIKSNITLKDETISNEDIFEACKFVNADKLINKLPNGLEEEVRERGNNFSAGERQLLSFARTVVHKPNIMILDEATANIDTETEVLIQESLNRMMNIGTMLIVAHRLSTIQHADKIIVLKHGRIIEQGTHQELLAKGGYYYQLYSLQYRDQEK